MRRFEKPDEKDIGVIVYPEHEKFFQNFIHKNAFKKYDLSSAEKHLVFIHPISEKKKKVKIGLGFDFFLFGAFAFLFRGLFKEFIIIFILLDLIDNASLLVFHYDIPSAVMTGIIGTLFGVYGNLFVTYVLHKRGWILKKPSDKTKEYLLDNWGTLFPRKNKNAAADYLDSLMFSR